MIEDVFSYMNGREGNRISRGFKIRQDAYKQDTDDEGLSNDEVNPNYHRALPVSNTLHSLLLKD